MQRIIERDRQAEAEAPERRFVGRVEPEPKPETPRRWNGETVEVVVGKMDGDLGPWPDNAYQVRE